MSEPTRILIVEDDPSSRECLALLLDGEGFQVHAVAAGPAALAKLAQEHYDILLTDLVMPGMSGLELIRTARLTAPGLRCIVMTGQPFVDEPGVAWIAKPINIDLLLGRLA